MNSREAEEYINRIQGFGSVMGLDSVRELCKRLGNPQERLSFVHIAGTNGKGSVLALVSTVLKAAGFRTGRFFSPTIFEYREGIQVNEHIMSRADFCSYLERVKTAADGMTAEGLPHPTIFEIDTAMAFCYFLDKKCDIVVLESGMGGALDATNIIANTLAAVLTPISADHEAYLGKSYQEIAANKAGIIKKGCTVVSAPQHDAASRVIKDKCRLTGCPLVWARPEQARGIKYGNYLSSDKNSLQRFTYGSCKDLAISLAGKYQIDNAVVALEVLAVLAQKGFPVKEQKLRKGMMEAAWPGRFQILAKKPLFIADGAHNEAAAAVLAESLRFYFTKKKIIYIIGILRDKDYRKILERTYAYAEQIITVTTLGPRGMGAYELAREARGFHDSVTCADSLEEAIELAGLLAGKDGVIVAFGSLSYLGKLIKIIENNRKQQK